MNDILCELMGCVVPEQSEHMKKLIKNRGMKNYSSVTIYIPKKTMIELAGELRANKCDISLCGLISAPVIGKTISGQRVYEIVLGETED